MDASYTIRYWRVPDNGDYFRIDFLIHSFVFIRLLPPVKVAAICWNGLMVESAICNRKVSVRFRIPALVIQADGGMVNAQ